MPKLRQLNAGFTLIELLVVVVLIAIMGYFVYLYIDDGNEDRQLRAFMKQLHISFSQASQEAIIAGHAIGLAINEEKIIFLKPTIDGWRQYAKSHSLKPININPRWAIELWDDFDQRIIVKAVTDNKSINPLLLFMEDGSSSAFKLAIENQDKSIAGSISTDGLGHYETLHQI